MNPVRKGTDLLIEAFAAVAGPARLVIHTQMDVGSLFPRLRTKLDDLRKHGRIEYIEKSVPAPGLYHLGDVYVYPSRLDGIGLTMPEALACGLPVIAPDCAPMNEFLDDTSGSLVSVAKFVARHDGYYWPQSIADVDGLRIAMQRYVDQIDSIGERKRSSRLYAEQHLDWHRNASDLCGLFGRIRPIPAADRAEALRKACAFEDARSRLNLRTWLSVKSPALIQAARSAWRAISPRS
jgi:glycosyltransferase involved in cell wall biosynthesis